MLYGSPRPVCAAFIMITLHEPSINQLPSTESTDTAGESADLSNGVKPFYKNLTLNTESKGLWKCVLQLCSCSQKLICETCFVNEKPSTLLGTYLIDSMPMELQISHRICQLKSFLLHLHHWSSMKT